MRYLLVVALIALSACMPDVESPPHSDTDAMTLRPLAPPDGTIFVESALSLSWHAIPLAENQYYVVRLWYEDQPYREVWTENTELDVQEMIDSYERAVGEFHWQVAAVNADSETGAFVSMASEWSPAQTLQRLRREPLTPLPVAQLSPTARLIHDQNFETAAEKIDFTRNWMFENTNLGQNTLIAYRADHSDAAQAMYDHSLGQGEAPRMWCDGISTAMLTVLRELGIESRIVFLYGEALGWISEHTVLEVFDPDTQRWHVQDPTINTYYLDTETDERSAINRMVFGDLDTVAGCRDGRCDTDENMAYITPLLGAFRYGAVHEVWVNPDRLNISRRIEAFDNQNFPEFVATSSGLIPSEMILRFDNWDRP